MVTFEVVGRVKALAKSRIYFSRKMCIHRNYILHVISNYCTLNWKKHNNGTLTMNSCFKFRDAQKKTLQESLFILRVSDISGVRSNVKYWA